MKNEKFGIINVFIAWKDEFPREVFSEIDDETIVMISWEPYRDTFNEASILPNIAEGKYDDLITGFADSCKSFGKPVIIRWGHEMNGNWYPWSGSRLNRSAEIYKRAYRKIREIFKSEKCENVTFVFCVNSSDVPAKKWNRLEEYYPGSDYVDYVGIDVYNWGNTKEWDSWFWKRSRWSKPIDIISKPYERIIKLAPEKPILVCEVGTTSSGGNKQQWMEQFFRSIQNNFKAVKGFIWFDYNKETDWSISRDSNTWDTFQKMTNDQYFKNDYTTLEVFN
ncbi:glycoside hydrolase family 26 protein [Candidatus Latescibacterota bacterium]